MGVRNWTNININMLMKMNNNNENENGLLLPHLYISKRSSSSSLSWIVKTESNVRKQIRKKADPHNSCVICKGSGSVPCHICCGQGRTNSPHLTMLPKGEWPKWCKTCGATGLTYCSRCLGTGEYRHQMGFNFIQTQDYDDHQHPSTST